MRTSLKTPKEIGRKEELFFEYFVNVNVIENPKIDR